MFKSMLYTFCFCLSTLWASEESAFFESSQANNRFALDLYKSLSQNSENICFSPYSISSALAMTYLGAREETKKEIAKVFYFAEDPQAVAKGFFEMNRFLKKSSDRCFVTADHSLWVQNEFIFNPEFKKLVDTYYPENLQTVDFVSAPEEAVSLINCWVKEQTREKIQDILSPNDIHPWTRLVLISSIYLKAEWASKFVADWTRDKTFFATKESSFDVPMMVNQKKYLAFENEELKLIKLPYRRSEKGAPDLEMLILLPNDLEGLADLEKALTLEQLNQWTQAMKKRDVSLTLPKFKVLETIELKDILSSLGMRVPFTRLADFGGISEDTALGIDKIIHKAFLEVNEEGTEAAAVTAVVMQTTCAYEPSEPLIFCADHPFIYILKEKKSGMILFMGRVSRPSCSP